MFEEMMGDLVRVGDAIDRPILVEPYHASPSEAKARVTR
jgi:hypothetical protein